MYCYKLNNSYTVYVNYAFYTEANKKWEKYKQPCTAYTTRKEPTRVVAPKQSAVAKPLPANTAVRHVIYGNGTIVNTDRNGHMSVRFGDKEKRFQYPYVFQQGYLMRA